MEARGVGALDASAASKLRDALLVAAAEVHADAGVVLATSPDASSALQHAWLRACPIVDGADLETHVAVALFWGLHRDERRAASATAGATQKVTDRNLSASVPNADALAAAVRAAGFDDDALEGGGAFACAADAAAKATPAGKAGRARQKPP